MRFLGVNCPRSIGFYGKLKQLSTNFGIPFLQKSGGAMVPLAHPSSEALHMLIHFVGEYQVPQKIPAFENSWRQEYLTKGKSKF